MLYSSTLAGKGDWPLHKNQFDRKGAAVLKGGTWQSWDSCLSFARG